MSGYRLIRQVRSGWYTVGIGMDDSGGIAYLVRPLDEAMLERLADCPHLPRNCGSAEIEGQMYSIFLAPDGTTLDALTDPLTQDAALSVLEAVCASLKALDEIGLLPRAGLISPRVLVVDHAGMWHLDFLAASLGTQEGQAVGLDDAAGDLTRLCFALLSRPELSHAPGLQRLQAACSSGKAPATLVDWEMLLQSLRGAPPAPRRRPLTVMLTAAALVIAGVTWGVLRPGGQEIAVAKNPEPASEQAASAPPERQPEPTLASPGSAPTEPRTWTDPGRALERNLELLADMYGETRITPEAEEPAAAPAPAPTPQPKPTVLPGPYCESGVLNSMGENRHFVVDGVTVCTAHVVLRGGVMFVSHDALAHVADTSVARLEPSEFMRRDGILWIAVQQKVMNQFKLTLEWADRTTILLVRR